MAEDKKNNGASGDGAGYEKSDISANKIFLWGVISLVILVILVVFMVDFFTATKEELIYESVLRPESAALRELRAKEAEILSSYGVVDSAAGTYRIPIDRAMELVVQEANSPGAKSR